eukprot:ctg_2222.g538
MVHGASPASVSGCVRFIGVRSAATGARLGGASPRCRSPADPHASRTAARDRVSTVFIGNTRAQLPSLSTSSPLPPGSLPPCTRQSVRVEHPLPERRPPTEAPRIVGGRAAASLRCLRGAHTDPAPPPRRRRQER